ncbi:bifunctional 4-hydroxy-2-oxoglutarate aldolase/2-dehydro-3-deoxy-phosphogluconate aldolase [uncultured Vibrio sp.]|uniref:bifunctional 4-hydroxy-2-oxoglutarate aldolase/2-dehydro-3-deoxy-phosphogluconate aldolase n=1 Tax=uncultured Vibrio sp. TaxID=114054 RepID=UPI002631F2FD|nr:bifunctional 4-hydroxy-2-oxoglutarate aldolase/2-dehydro-3-deoxy-phosphogluconate aldolase [uncultured Vibrio sp.]
MKTLNERLSEIKVVPVIAIKDASKASKLAEVLIENGMPCAEITFRTEQAFDAIKAMREAFPEMLIGSGTVLTKEQVDLSIEAGVDFVVSPGFNPTTVKYCQQRNVTIVPGVNNPSLVEQAMEMGLRTLKFFPAEPSGGVNMLKALTAVYPVNFMPTGGVNPKNVNYYLAIPSVLACGGTWMVPNDLIDNEKWEELAVLVREVAGIID